MSSELLAELYDRAIVLMSKLADSAEEAAESFDVPLPEELAKAWVDSQALAHVMTCLIDSEVIPRERLKELYVAGRELADEYEDPDADMDGHLHIETAPTVDDELLDAITQLEEEVRRARLLSS